MTKQFVFNLNGSTTESYQIDNELEALQFARKLAFEKNLLPSIFTCLDS